jgi:tRNA(Phe) wybutosine-synthesizing methylase Tyw3
VKTEIMDTIVNTADQIMVEVGKDLRKLETRIEKLEEAQITTHKN